MAKWINSGFVQCQYFREKQCSQGHETAKSGRECGLGFGPEENFHKVSSTV